MTNDRVESMKRHGYWSCENLVLDVYLPEIGNSAFILYCALCRIAMQKDNCFPGKEYLMHKARQSKNTLQKNLVILKQYSLIRIVPQYDEDGAQVNNVYLLLPLPDDLVEEDEDETGEYTPVNFWANTSPKSGGGGFPRIGGGPPQNVGGRGAKGGVGPSPPNGVQRKRV